MRRKLCFAVMLLWLTIKSCIVALCVMAFFAVVSYAICRLFGFSVSDGVRFALGILAGCGFCLTFAKGYDDAVHKADNLALHSNMTIGWRIVFLLVVFMSALVFIGFCDLTYRLALYLRAL